MDIRESVLKVVYDKEYKIMEDYWFGYVYNTRQEAINKMMKLGHAMDRIHDFFDIFYKERISHE